MHVTKLSNSNMTVLINGRQLNISRYCAMDQCNGTGLCSCRVRGVDGSCAKHLTVESYMVIYAPNSYTY